MEIRLRDELFEIAFTGSEEQMRKFLQNPQVKVNQTRLLRRAALHKSAEFNPDIGVTKALLDHPSIDVNSLDVDGRTPLHAVSWKNKRFECVRLLLQRSDILVNTHAKFGFTQLHAAARFACPKVLELLLAHSRVTIDAKTVDGFTALHLVAEGGENHHPGAGSVRPWEDRCQVVRMLLEAERQRRARNLPCNLNKQDVLQRFPIHYGVECDSVNVMKELLNWEDANINQLDLYGLAPLHLAVRSTVNHRTVVVESLLQAENIDVNIASVRSSSDVQRLKMAGKNEAGLDLFFPFRPLEAPQESSTNLTPLHFAAKMGSTRIVDLLLGSPKIELNVRDSRHYTPLHFAAQVGHVEVVKTFLREAPGRVNFEAEDDEGLTPVWRATLNDRLEVATLLWDVTSRQEYERIDTLVQRLLTVDQSLTTVRFLVNSFPEDKLIQVIEEMGNADDLKFETTRANLLGRLEKDVAFPNGTRSQDETLLHWVAKNNHCKLIPQILISKRHTGGFVNLVDSSQNTALHYAAETGHADVVKTLLAEAPELDLNLKGSDRKTPLHLATKKGHIDVVKALCQNPHKQRLLANEEDERGETCLQYATEHDNIPKEIANTLMDRSDVKDFLNRHYRDRQVFVDAANALLVGGALIAGLSFASWLQPPLSFTPYYQFPQSTPATPPATYESFAAVELHYSLRLFWTFNDLSFFFAVATVVSGAEAAFPHLDAVFVVKAVQIVRRALIRTSILLVFSVITVLGAFVCAGFTVLPPIARDVNSMTISTVFGMLVCCVVLCKFSAKLFRAIFKIIKRTPQKW